MHTTVLFAVSLAIRQLNTDFTVTETGFIITDTGQEREAHSRQWGSGNQQGSPVTAVQGDEVPGAESSRNPLEAASFSATDL